MAQGEKQGVGVTPARSGLIHKKYYDAVFVGSALVSLATAALLCKRGRSVCFLDTTDAMEDSVPDVSFYYTLGPFLYFGFEKGGAMEGFFSELGLPIPNLRKDGLIYQRCNPSIQIVQSSHRVNIFSQKDEYVDELKREFGKQLENIKSYLKEIERVDRLLYPFMGRFSQLELQGVGDRLNEWGQKRDFLNLLGRHQRKTALNFVKPYVFDKSFLQFLDLQSIFAYRKPLLDISAYELIVLISGLQRGGVRVIGGCRTVIHFLQKLILRWGGEIVQGKSIMNVEMKGKRIIEGLRFNDGSLLRGRQFMISQSKHDSALCFYYRLRGEIIPSPMRETLTMTWGTEPPKNFIDALIVRLSLAQEEAGFSEGFRGLSVTALLKPGMDGDLVNLDDLKNRVLERLHWLIPFSNGTIEEVGEPTYEPSGSSVEPGFFSREFEHRFMKNAKPVTKGLLHYRQAREGKNLFLLPSDFSEPIGGGVSFLAAKSLADIIEKLK